jgi:hypothetical protein
VLACRPRAGFVRAVITLPPPPTLVLCAPQIQAQRAARSQEAAERNAAALEAANHTQEAWRQALAEKLEAANQRTVGPRAAREVQG